jgi:hypothetical protein
MGRMVLLHQRELPYHPQMVTEEDIRRVALALPGTAEKPYNRLPAFRVRGDLFIRIHELPDAFLVRCAGLEERNELLQAEPRKFFITPHYDGYPAVLVRLSQVDLDEMTELVTESWRVSAPKRLLAATTRSIRPRSDRRGPCPRTEQRMSVHESRQVRSRDALLVQDLLAQDVRVPAVLSEFAQHVEVYPAQRERAAPVAEDHVVQPQG